LIQLVIDTKKPQFLILCLNKKVLWVTEVSTRVKKTSVSLNHLFEV